MWLVRGTLLMGWGLLHDFFWNFSMRDESAHARWEMVTRGGHKGRMPTRGEVR